MAASPQSADPGLRSRFTQIVFDLDGTLVDSRQDIAEAANAVLEGYGFPPHSEDAIGRMVGEGAATLIARAFTAAHASTPPDALARFIEIYSRRLLQCTRPYDGIPSLLAALAPRATLSVLTNKPIAPTRAILDGLELTNFFGDRILGGDGPLPRKPDPGGLRQLVDAAGSIPAATLMVGDSLVDWKTARAAGTTVCMARYGFGFGEFPAATLAPTDLTIDHPLDLLGLV